MEAYMKHFVGILSAMTVDILLALAVLIGGWLVALAISAITRKILVKSQIDKHMTHWADETGRSNYKLSLVISRITFYILILLVLVGFFRVLGVTVITEPLGLLINQIFSYLPSLFGALLVFLVAWIIASALKFIVIRILNASKIDKALEDRASISNNRAKISENIASVAYWLVFLLFLPLILNTLNLHGVIIPIQAMIQELLGFIPNVFGASIILVFGWLFARICKQVVTSLLLSMGTNQISDKVGLQKVIGNDNISVLLGKITYALILVPTIIAALNALKIQAISEPATQMLTVVLNSVPYVFAAILVIFIAYVVGKLVANLVESILSGIGFNHLFVTLGLSRSDEENSKQSPSHIVGLVTLVGIMLFAFVEASELLGFSAGALIMSQLLHFMAQATLGILIFGLGLYLSQLAQKIIMSTGGSVAVVLSQVARVTIIVIAAGMGLTQIGIAQDMINLILSFVIGAVALAVALAFGFGSKEIAARELEGFLKNIRKKD